MNHFSSYQLQYFSFPNPIINQILANPSTPNIYQKLTKTCKYFYAKNPILLIDSLLVETPLNDCACTYFNIQSTQTIMLNDIPTKLWIIKRFATRQDNVVDTNIVSLIVSKLYRCNINHLTLYSQNITLKEFSLLTVSVKNCVLSRITVRYDDESVVPFEAIIQKFPVIEKLRYHFPPISNVSPKTVKEVIKLPQFVNLKNLWLLNIPEEFDVETFADYKNLYTPYMNNSEFRVPDSTKILLHFRQNLPENYIERIKNAFARNKNLNFHYRL